VELQGCQPQRWTHGKSRKLQNNTSETMTSGNFSSKKTEGIEKGEKEKEGEGGMDGEICGYVGALDLSMVH